MALKLKTAGDAVKITFILPGRGHSGGVRVTVQMAGELTRRQHDIVVLYKARPCKTRAVLSGLYKKVFLRGADDWISQTNETCRSFKTLTEKLVGRRDILIAVGPDCVEEIVQLPDTCGQKIFYAHGLTLRNPLLREKSWYAKIPKLAVSSYVRHEMLQAKAENIVAVISNGVNTDEYFPDEEGSERRGVGAVYGPGVAKDPETILSVFAKLHSLRPDIPLVCFGSGKRPEALNEVVQYQRLPTVAEARRLYCRSAVWFCVSRSEGFGMPLLEAMACGCAVVSTDCGGQRDFILPGKNGIVVDRGSSTEIAKEIVKLLDGESKRTQLANEGLKTAQMRTWSQAAEQLEQALQEILTADS